MSRAFLSSFVLIFIALSLPPAFGVGSAFAQAPARARVAQESPLRKTLAYWPLAVGNSWTYTETTKSRVFDSDGLEIRVIAEEAHGQYRYFRVVGMFGQEALLRMTSQGDVVEWVPDEGVERLWYQFSVPVGGGWQPKTGDDCLGRAVISSRDLDVTVRSGTYKDALRIEYGPGPCADAGATEEVFARGAGLLRREIITIAGPRTFELREASIGGKLVRGPGLSFGLTVDRIVYTPSLFPPVDPNLAAPTLEAAIVIENTTDQPLVLEFPSGQQFDLEIRNATGESMYRWSADKSFVAVLTTIVLDPGRKSMFVSVPLGDRHSATPWPAGSYVVEAWLTTTAEKAYSASVAIEIAQPAN